MEAYQPRAYQLEMLRKSMQRNIIVAMDTGSGKTHVAVLRIAEELKKPGSDEKLIWFLCPSVALAHQQHSVMRSQLPAVLSRLIVGDDGVDHWSTQEIWDAIFYNMRIVVSTYAVLHDALKHGFVTMEKLSLLVVDEAHHCARKNPLNRIMQDFYYSRKAVGGSVPNILGLTASPVVRNSVSELAMIEQNLDAVCQSPKLSREELLRHVNLPSMILVPYQKSLAETIGDETVMMLRSLYETMDMSEDPWVVHLRSGVPNQAANAFFKALVGRKTYSCEQIRSIISNLDELSRELGPWASHYYLVLVKNEIELRLGRPDGDQLRGKELLFILEFLQAIEDVRIEPLPPRREEISPKVLRLMELLSNEVTEGTAGIVFVKTRATVDFLARLLSTSCLKDIVRVGTFVGQSNSQLKVSRICENIGKFDQMDNLHDLRTGMKNLIVCTNACEEGIDISACNFVICFDSPPNLKSFIQRRGRARAKSSKYIIMHDEAAESLKRDWPSLEEEMKKAYLDDLRKLQETEELEDSEEAYRDLKVDDTGAKLTLEDSVSHLDHFCNKLPVAKFASPHPTYAFSKDDEGQITCVVELPVSMDASLRKFSSSAWTTEKLAKKDAAFEAYAALYKAGLVNSNLLPEPREDKSLEDLGQYNVREEQIIDTPVQLDQLVSLAQAWENTDHVFLYSIEKLGDTNGTVYEGERNRMGMMLCLPVKLHSFIAPLQIFWDDKTQFELRINTHSTAATSLYNSANRATHALLYSVFRARMPQEEIPTFPILFFPVAARECLVDWASNICRTYAAGELPAEWKLDNDAQSYMIRANSQVGKPFEYQGTEEAEVGVWPDYKTKELRPCYKVKKLPKRTDFLRPASKTQKSEIPDRHIEISSSLIQLISPPLAKYALLIPSIMHHISLRYHAQDFWISFLKNSGALTDLGLILEAITAPQAQEPVNYQRLEFLGDAVLGFYVSLTLMASHERWHEGYLTMGKGRLVSNSNLCKAAIDTGLVRYIVTSKFTGSKWVPPTNKALRETHCNTKQRKMSAKTLADVVEALIGASYCQGSENGGNPWENVLEMLKLFIPKIEWIPFGDHLSTLQSSVNSDIPLPPHFEDLQALLDYRFKRPALLLEAMTHPSASSESSSNSYQRLEFLGDSVLESLVTRHIFRSNLPVAHMHLLRTASVNNSFLAFLAMKLTVTVEQKALTEVREEPGGEDVSGSNSGGARKHDEPKFVATSAYKQLRLHDFMFHAPSTRLAEARAQTAARFDEHEAAIGAALATGDRYPWSLLARFGPEKLFGDVVESTLAAVFVDSGGDEETCVALLARLGVWDFLDRAVADDIHVMQPKQELGIAAGQQKVTYKVEPGLETGIYVCQAMVGERQLGTASGRSRAEAETLAAADALNNMG